MSKANKSNSRDAKDDYEVGYGKPPKCTRFTSGQSGNPKGRPKGVRNFGTDVKSTLSALVKVVRDGKPRKVSTQEAMLLRLREKALGGDARALDRLIGLAQAYNNEQLTATASASADDAMLLEIYRARVLSGAAGGPDPAEASAGPLGGAPSGGPIDSDVGVESNVQRKRVRLNKA